MTRRTFGQLFDAPAEIIIAHGRVVLSVISLAAVSFEPTKPAQHAPLVVQILIFYATFALAVLAGLHWRLTENPNAIALHVIDLSTLALLLSITDGLSSPFLVFFPFVLIGASLRWDWQGTALTMAVLVAVAAVIALAEFVADGRLRNVSDTIIRAGYLGVMGTALAYASAHREHERGRLMRLARQSSAFTPAPGLAALAAVLRDAAATEGQAALAVWKEEDEGWRAALWRDGHYNVLVLGSRPLSVAPELEGEVFSRIGKDADRVNLVNGVVRRVADVLQGDLLWKIDIGDFATAPFTGVAARGRIFILGHLRHSDDILPIAKIVADRVGAEIDRQIFLRRATEDAATRERTRLMRDLHDGLLQSLTAARAQIEALPPDETKAESQLETARSLLRMEQRRLREFVDAALAKGKLSSLEILRPRVEETARLWGCSLALSIDQPKTLIPRATLNELSLMLAEAVANAVRHGEAEAVEVALQQKDNRLQVEVRDNGRGFTEGATATSGTELAENELPRSLYTRASDLGGRMRAWTSRSGAVLRFELPL
jgi:signal transduction histidine kinase